MSLLFYQLTTFPPLWSSVGVNETASYEAQQKQKIMKTKTLLAVALIGVAAASAQAGVSWNVSIGLPLPVFVSQPVVCNPPPVVYAAPPVVCAPPQVVYAAPCPPPASAVFVQSAPVYSQPGYATVNFGGSPQAFGYVAADGHYIHHPIQYEHQQEHRERVQYLRATRW